MRDSRDWQTPSCSPSATFSLVVRPCPPICIHFQMRQKLGPASHHSNTTTPWAPSQPGCNHQKSQKNFNHSVRGRVSGHGAGPRVYLPGSRMYWYGAKQKLFTAPLRRRIAVASAASHSQPPCRNPRFHNCFDSARLFASRVRPATLQRQCCTDQCGHDGDG